MIECGPDDLDAEFQRRNAHLLRQRKGGGYWIWKPYLIERELQTLGDGDCLIYADAGVFFTGFVTPVARLLRGDSVLVFENRFGIEREWTKRDVFVRLGCDSPRYTDTNQIMATISVWTRSSASLDLVGEWLRLVQDARLVTDMPTQNGLPDYAGFRAHRHDQSIFSLLCKQRGISPHRMPWISTEAKYPHSDYPVFALRSMNNPAAVVRFAALPQIGPSLRAYMLVTAAAGYQQKLARYVGRRLETIGRTLSSG